MNFRFLALVLAATLGSAAFADEASVRKAIQARVGNVPVRSVTKTPYAGLYEVVLGDDDVVYTDENVSYLFTGGDGGVALVDLKTGRNLTEERVRQLLTINFKDLPLDAAIKTVHGAGRRVFATFEDPNCPYCKRLWQDVLSQLDDVTIYTFLYPILRPDSVVKARAIWCSKDRSHAWVDHMLTASMPPPAAPCDDPIEKNVALGRRLRVTGTPTMFFTNGQRLVGARPDELMKLLDASTK